MELKIDYVLGFIICEIFTVMSRLSGDLQGHSRWTYPSGPDPIQTHPPRPDLDSILTRKGQFQVQTRSKSGPNQVCAEVFGGVGARGVGLAGMAL